MPLLCLLGRHGSGKSTIGALLAAAGHPHVSVGLLRRLAQARQFPSDIPPGLMLAMRRERAGAPLSPATAARLLQHVCAVPSAVLDGFPASPEHVAMLPPDAVFCVVWTPSALRDTRLEDRSAKSKRQWTPGLTSARESALPSVLRIARRSGRCIFLRNDQDASAAVEILAKKLAAIGLHGGIPVV